MDVLLERAEYNPHFQTQHNDDQGNGAVHDPHLLNQKLVLIEAMASSSSGRVQLKKQGNEEKQQKIAFGIC